MPQQRSSKQDILLDVHLIWYSWIFFKIYYEHKKIIENKFKIILNFFQQAFINILIKQDICVFSKVVNRNILPVPILNITVLYLKKKIHYD